MNLGWLERVDFVAVCLFLDLQSTTPKRVCFFTLIICSSLSCVPLPFPSLPFPSHLFQLSIWMNLNFAFLFSCLPLPFSFPSSPIESRGEIRKAAKHCKESITIHQVGNGTTEAHTAGGEGGETTDRYTRSEQNRNFSASLFLEGKCRISSSVYTLLCSTLTLISHFPCNCLFVCFSSV